ncbi:MULTISPECIES: hypothetical protein [Sporosarcina]|uniref:Uncharacterized protein n=1 Tax=Sporosarcina contaminans TaxID=633403 RepID=A0ABW3TV32_9BACL
MNLQKGLTLRFSNLSGKIYEVIYDQYINGSYIWSMRLVAERDRQDLLDLVREAQNKHQTDNYTSFYKMESSDFLEWYDGIAMLGSEHVPNVEHHVYITSEYVIEVLSEYEPKVNIIG